MSGVKVRNGSLTTCPWWAVVVLMCLIPGLGGPPASGLLAQDIGLDLLQLECLEEDWEACNALEVYYNDSRQIREAAEVFGRACDAGLHVACSNLGELYFDGRGVQKSLVRAGSLFQGACEAGIVSGCAGQCIVARQGNALPKADQSRCRDVISRSCAEGNSWMCAHRPATPVTRKKDSPACTQRGARAIARAYSLSAPLVPGDIEAYVAGNRELFLEAGEAARCAKMLGAKLLESGIKAYDPKAYERAMGAGPAELAPDVATSINSGAVDMFSIGRELLWLSEVLPAAAAGNWEPYQNSGTETRQMIRQMLPAAEAMMTIDPGMREIVSGVMGQFQPIVEEQIFMLAMMVGK